jgi:hypothetical protein
VVPFNALPGKSKVRIFQVGKKAAAGSLYHGSPVHGLSALRPSPSHVLGGQPAVFATPDRDLAIAMLAPWRDGDFEQGYVNGKPYMREQYPGAFDKTYKGKSGTLYELPDEGFTPDPRLMRVERINRGEVPVTKAERIDDVLEALQQTRFKLIHHDGLNKTANAALSPETTTTVAKGAPMRPTIEGLQLVIDRPKGFKKMFPTPAGPVERSYPVDYGYVQDITNPDDNEGADVFVGTNGQLHSRFMKGKNLTGSWEPDERKWYTHLTPDELAAVKEMFHSQSPDLLQDFTEFPSTKELAADLHGLKQASDTLTQLRLAKQHSDAGRYPEKTALLRGLIQSDPAAWQVDSVQGLNVGITHRTGWRFHLPAAAVGDLLKIQ